MIRVLMVAVAVFAALLLLASALDYTQIRSRTVKRVRLISPRVPLVRLS